jgi:hypothetical protein
MYFQTASPKNMKETSDGCSFEVKPKTEITLNHRPGRKAAPPPACGINHSVQSSGSVRLSGKGGKNAGYAWLLFTKRNGWRRSGPRLTSPEFPPVG